VMETFVPANEGLVGRTIGSIAAARGVDPFDTFLDIALADGLRTYVRMPPDEDSDAIWQLRLETWRDRRAILGDTDTGAHLDMMCGARCMTAFLGESVRQRRLLDLEEAIHLVTDRPARFYGLVERGRVAEGWWADLVVFDPETIGSDDATLVRDLPGDSVRLTAGSQGVVRVLVNGVETVADGKATGATPGTVLRAGRDTNTVLP